MHVTLSTRTALNGLYLCLNHGLNSFFVYVGITNGYTLSDLLAKKKKKKTQKEFNISYVKQFKNHFVEGVSSSWSKFNRRS